jgi:hypothetical protein
MPRIAEKAVERHLSIGDVVGGQSPEESHLSTIVPLDANLSRTLSASKVLAMICGSVNHEGDIEALKTDNSVVP